MEFPRIAWLLIHALMSIISVQEVCTIRFPLNAVSGAQSCGRARDAKRRSVKRILGGHVSSPDQWPWVVSVHVQRGRGHLMCGGGIIGDEWILTAAHCLEDILSGDHETGDNRHVIVTLGRRMGTRELLDGRHLHVDRIYFHPLRKHRERGKIGQHDIAVLHLKEPFVTGDGVVPLCLPEENQRGIGLVCTVAGWGQDRASSGASVFLRHVSLKVISNSVCSAILGMDVFPLQMCAMADVNHASCKGDSGSPFVCNHGGRFHLTGIVSFGTPCGLYAESTPTVLTYVYPYLPWILRTVGK